MKKRIPSRRFAFFAGVLLRDEINALQTVFWYQNLRFLTGCPGVAALERLIEPGLAQRAKKRLYHGNKWYGYQRGRHSPRRSLRERAELHAPGSSAAFDHAFWTVLRTEVPLGKRANSLLRRSGECVEALMFQRSAEVQTAVRRPVTRHLLTQLEALPFLDALAALTILLREALEYNRPKWVRDIVDRILQILLVDATTGRGQAVASLLYLAYLERIFPLVTRDPQFGIDFTGYDFKQNSLLLFDRLLWAEDNYKVTLNRRDGVRYLRGLLKDRFGSPWRWRLLRPLFPQMPEEFLWPNWRPPPKATK